MIDSDDFGIPEDELIVLRSDYKICWCANLGLSVNTTPITYYPENQEKSTVVSNWQIKKAIARIEGLSSVRWSFNCSDKQCKCGVFESQHKQIKGNFAFIKINDGEHDKSGEDVLALNAQVTLRKSEQEFNNQVFEAFFTPEIDEYNLDDDNDDYQSEEQEYSNSSESHESRAALKTEIIKLFNGIYQQDDTKTNSNRGHGQQKSSSKSPHDQNTGHQLSNQMEVDHFESQLSIKASNGNSIDDDISPTDKLDQIVKDIKFDPEKSHRYFATKVIKKCRVCHQIGHTFNDNLCEQRDCFNCLGRHQKSMCGEIVACTYCSAPDHQSKFCPHLTDQRVCWRCHKIHIKFEDGRYIPDERFVRGYQEEGARYGYVRKDAARRAECGRVILDNEYANQELKKLPKNLLKCYVCHLPGHINCALNQQGAFKKISHDTIFDSYGRKLDQSADLIISNAPAKHFSQDHPYSEETKHEDFDKDDYQLNEQMAPLNRQSNKNLLHKHTLLTNSKRIKEESTQPAEMEIETEHCSDESEHQNLIRCAKNPNPTAKHQSHYENKKRNNHYQRFNQNSNYEHFDDADTRGNYQRQTRIYPDKPQRSNGQYSKTNKRNRRYDDVEYFYVPKS